MSEDLPSLWLCEEKTGRAGASTTYRDDAIEICLSLRVLLHLALRQTEGFVRSLLSLSGLNLPIPDYTTLCRRQKDLNVLLPVRSSEKPRHIVIDSTGLKVYGEGEWKVKKHGKSRRRVQSVEKAARASPLAHLSVDEATGEVRVQARLRW